MTRRFLFVGATVLAVACLNRPYQPAGGSPALNVNGTYSARESLYSSNCPGMAARQQAVRVDVHHNAGALTLKLTLEGQSFDAQIRPDGNFTTAPQTIPRGGSTTTTTIAGRFLDTGFAARITIRTTERIAAARPGDPTSRTCDYQLRWQAEKL
jgi:hypothetical protein